MMQPLGEWITGLAGAAMLSAAAMCIAPEGQAKKVVRLVCSAAVLLAFLSIGTDFDFDSYSQRIAEIKRDADDAAGRFAGVSQGWSRLIIQEDCDEYILVRAGQLGVAHIEVGTELEYSEKGYWYPVAVNVRTDADAGAKERLAAIIETELGIPKERQEWDTYDG